MDSASRITKPLPALRRRKTDVRVLPLEHGDRLTVEEFERRYEAMPEVKKAELIEGVVYTPSPVTMDYHAENHLRKSKS
jgi:hypothetical protein